jgi:hypothetical protein
MTSKEYLINVFSSIKFNKPCTTITVYKNFTPSAEVYVYFDKTIGFKALKPLENKDKSAIFFIFRKLLRKVGKDYRVWVEESENSRQKYLEYLGFAFKKRKGKYNKYVWTQ